MRVQAEKTKAKKIKKMTRKMREKLLFVFCVILVGVLVIIGRLLYIGGKDSYEKNALAQQSYVSAVIPYKRGDILDRNGQTLATSELIYHLILDPKVLLDKEENVDVTIQALTTVYGLKEAELRRILANQPNSSYVVLKKSLNYEEKQAWSSYTEALGETSGKVKGVWFEEEYRRSYPFSTIASHIIGFTVAGDVGTYGIEQQYEERLTGTNGRTYGYYDAQLNIERTTKPAVDGETIVSTIDINVQRVAQKYVERFLNETGAENVGVVLLEADSGEILAMQSNYSYNLNQPRSLDLLYSEEEQEAMSAEERLAALYRIWRNYCISDAYEPGSTFKPLLVASALEEKVVMTGEEFVCDGKETFTAATIRCSNQRGHGRLSLAQSLMFSCNDAMMQIAAKEGRTLFHAYQEHFLLGVKTGIDLPGETTGSLFTEAQLNETELATSSFGQGFTVNMTQMAAAFAALINGGSYYEPHVVKTIKNAEGATVKAIQPVVVTRAVSAETSAFIKEAMYLTVESGTATAAKVNGYRIGGKTGTAQKLPRDAKKNLVSFLGFVEGEERCIVIYVVVDEAHDETLMKKSSTASSMAAAILEEALPYLGVYPEGEINYHLELIGEEDLLLDENAAPEENESAPDVME